MLPDPRLATDLQDRLAATALHAEAIADGARIVAIRLLPSTLSAVVVRDTGWLPPRERGAVEIRRWPLSGSAWCTQCIPRQAANTRLGVVGRHSPQSRTNRTFA
jgi:hypothetical protein